MLDNSDYIFLRTNLSNKTNTFLADSQADISVIKIIALTKQFKYDPTEIINVKGVTNEKSLMGTVLIDLL